MKKSVRSHRRQGPWFQWHPALAVAVGISLYGIVFVLRLDVAGTQDAITALYALPIALLAVAFGLRAGAVAGIIGAVLLTAWVAIDGVSLTPLDFAVRAVPLILLGVLLGSATDRLRVAAELEKALVGARLREREAAEINDSIIQGLAVAKWSLEAGDR